MTSKNKAKFILPLIVILITGGLYQLLMTSKAERKQPQLKEKVWQIKAIKAQLQSLSPNLKLYGRIESPELLRTAAPGNGVVEQVFVRNGDSVQKGQNLVHLDPRDFESALLQAKADQRDIENQITELDIRHRSNLSALDAERELLRIAKAEVNRLDKLHRQNLSAESALNAARSEQGRQQLQVISRELGVDRYVSQQEMLKARLEGVAAQHAKAQLAMERSVITAPFDAIVSSVAISKGDRVNLGESLVSLFPVSDLEIRAHLPAKYISSVQQAIVNGEPLFASVPAHSNLQPLQLQRLAGEAESTGIDLYFSIDESSAQMRPGELLALELILPTEANVIAVPYQAIYGNSRIYQVIEDRLQAVDVQTIGQTRVDGGPTQALIRSATIKSDDLIAITHLPNAISGLKVVTSE